jgi:four helix bundle protein
LDGGTARAILPFMDAKELQERTKRFTVRAVRFCQTLPSTWEARRIGGQLIDATTSVYANYRATCRGRSRAEFIAKIGVVAEEADESLGWLELIDALELSRGAELAWLLVEANQLVAIFAASQKTAKQNRQRSLSVNLPINRQSPNRQSTITEAPP